MSILAPNRNDSFLTMGKYGLNDGNAFYFQIIDR